MMRSTAAVFLWGICPQCRCTLLLWKSHEHLQIHSYNVHENNGFLFSHKTMDWPNRKSFLLKCYERITTTAPYVKMTMFVYITFMMAIA